MQRLTDVFHAGREHDDGFSIVEVLVAMTVFAMIAAAVATGIVGSLFLAHTSRSREVAIGLAQDAIDRARTATNLFSVVDSTTNPTVGGLQYTVKQVARWVPASGTANACGGGSGGPLAYKRISMTVSWSSSSTQSISMNSMVAPTTSVTAANLGTIIVSVSRVDGSGNAGVNVSIAPNAANPSGAGAITAAIAPTDTSGCTYALNVKAGRYDVSLSKPGNIDDGTSSGSLGAQTATPSTTVTVQANQTSAANFNYDAALTVAPQWADPNASATTTFTSPTTAPVSLRRKTADYGPYAAGTTTQVFPYTDGYKVVPGTPATCASVDPENWTTANGTAVAPRNVSQPQAGTNAMKAPVQIVTVKLAGKSDNALSATTTSPNANSGDPGCATPVTYSFTGLPAGGTAVIALPYGTYTLRSGTLVSILSGVVSINFGTGTPGVTTATGVTTSSNKVMLDPRRNP